jgi:hypothetical protein
MIFRLMRASPMTHEMPLQPVVYYVRMIAWIGEGLS